MPGHDNDSGGLSKSTWAIAPIVSMAQHMFQNPIGDVVLYQFLSHIQRLVYHSDSRL